MKCPDPPAHPVTAGVPRGLLLAVGVFAALALGVYVASAFGGVLVALAAAVVAGLAVTAGVTAVAVRWLYRFVLPARPQRRIRVTLQDGRLGAELVAGEPGRFPAPLAIEAPRTVPAVVVLGVDAGERLEA